MTQASQYICTVDQNRKQQLPLLFTASLTPETYSNSSAVRHCSAGPAVDGGLLRWALKSYARVHARGRCPTKRLDVVCCHEDGTRNKHGCMKVRVSDTYRRHDLEQRHDTENKDYLLHIAEHFSLAQHSKTRAPPAGLLELPLSRSVRSIQVSAFQPAIPCHIRSFRQSSTLIDG